MSRGKEWCCVLVVLPDSSAGGGYPEIVGPIEKTLGSQVTVRRGQSAGEYVHELGPTIDCALVLSDDDELVELLVEASNGVPVVVYGEGRADGVEKVIEPDEGVERLLNCLSAAIAADQRESELVEANAKLTALSEHASAITGCESVSEVCEETLAAAVDALAFTFCTVALVEDDRIVPRASTLAPDDYRSCHVSEGIAGRTYRTGKTQLVDDIALDDDTLFSEARRSTVSVPFGPYGVIQVVSNSPNAFDERDAEFLEILADYTAEALSRLDREAALRQERDRLRAFFDSHPVPVVSVEEVTAPGDRVRCETNHAYERIFPKQCNHVSVFVEEVFPTNAERRLFSDQLRAESPSTAVVERKTSSGAFEAFQLTVVPVPASGPTGSAYGVYTHADDSSPIVELS
ncbi:gaf domain-containing protein [Halogeometricum borinquense DSM 11551]|uniref:GAF domain-containing protein n=2 Tax=Halogeometricum borinquense TaxID=60847 RepID=E4NRA6_HALBP|nr:GAF domain-containing protein [Halogeometricum borinquense]ADQ67947.1 GAF domain-containing protein [Halogeometricum borinquense DSM 11551]ELY24133.1 gaf domain-containing protein [Halogeometricum borinquense DSM 11551]